MAARTGRLGFSASASIEDAYVDAWVSGLAATGGRTYSADPISTGVDTLVITGHGALEADDHACGRMAGHRRGQLRVGPSQSLSCQSGWGI